jgi:tetratricopeptide (TPR) repeat protein
MTTKSVRQCAMWLSLTAWPLLADQAHWRRAMAEAQSARQSARMQDAERAYDEALRAVDTDESLMLEKAIAISRRASLFHDLQRTREAEKGYLQALEILRRQPPESAKRDVGPLLISLAALYLEQDQPSKAISLKLETIIPSLVSPADKANANATLGSIAFAQKRYSEAKSFWALSLAVSETHARAEDVAAVLNNLGLAASLTGDLEGATVYFRRSLEVFGTELGPQHPLTVKVQANLGHTLFRLRRYAEATDWLQQAHELARKWYGDENAITVQLCLARAEALRKAGRKEEAKSLIKAAGQVPAAVRAALPGRTTVDVIQLNNQVPRR